MNHSPRIAQLDSAITYPMLNQNIQTNVLVVGAGIAGCATAHFILHDTDRSVVLVDGGQVARGATGYNAGWISAETEVTFQHLVEQYGLEIAARTRQGLLDGYEMIWGLVDLYNLDIDIVRLMGYEAIASFDQMMERLEQSRLLASANITCEAIMIVDGSPRISQIPAHLQDYISVVGAEVIADLIESSDVQYQAVRAWKGGTANSALLCEKLLQAMIQRYPDRLSIYEQTPVDMLVCDIDKAVAHIRQGHEIQSSRVVLCINGFEYLQIIDHDGDPIDASFHNNVTGVVGMMSGYYLPGVVDDSAVSYYPQHSDLVSEVNDGSEIYYYMTQRGYRERGGSHKRLVCIGGSDQSLADRVIYDPTTPVASGDIDSMMEFARTTITDMSEVRTHDFARHGLMGYTNNRLRCVGPEPRNPVLLYNLGCNGVGLVSSVYGGSLIAQYIRGDEVQKTAFEPN